MPVYRKRLDLEKLQAYLHGRGFRRSLLVTKDGEEELTITLDRDTVTVDQAGNVDRKDADADDLRAAIDLFRTG